MVVFGGIERSNLRSRPHFRDDLPRFVVFKNFLMRSDHSPGKFFLLRRRRKNRIATLSTDIPFLAVEARRVVGPEECLEKVLGR